MTKKVNLGNTSLNKIGATPFFLAAQTADAELMRTLAALGADPDSECGQQHAADGGGGAGHAFARRRCRNGGAKC